MEDNLRVDTVSKNFKILQKVDHDIRKTRYFSELYSMAQEQGFEPWHRVTDLQAFQACPFNRLGIPAKFS